MFNGHLRSGILHHPSEVQCCIYESVTQRLLLSKLVLTTFTGTTLNVYCHFTCKTKLICI